MATPKEAAKQLIDHLPEQASWDDIMYELYVKQKIEAGLRAVEEGRTIPHDEMKRRLLAKKRQA
jgi:predicted transcriptional regulator